MRYLITGGAGFVGSHLTDALIARGDRVLVLDDLSTGSRDEPRACARLRPGRAGRGLGLRRRAGRPVHGARRRLLPPRLRGRREADRLPLGRLALAQRARRPGRRRGGPPGRRAAALRLDLGDLRQEQQRRPARGLRPPPRPALGRPLVLLRPPRPSARRSRSAITASAAPTPSSPASSTPSGRGSRPHYGMVLPRFVSQALAGEDLTVYGDGSQSRCFCHVADSVAALVGLMDEEGARGQAFNVGRSDEITILELAYTVIERIESDSGVVKVPYEEAYGEGFEELGRRRPDTAALREMTGWRADPRGRGRDRRPRRLRARPGDPGRGQRPARDARQGRPRRRPRARGLAAWARRSPSRSPP